MKFRFSVFGVLQVGRLCSVLEMVVVMYILWHQSGTSNFYLVHVDANDVRWQSHLQSDID